MLAGNRRIAIAKGAGFSARALRLIPSALLTGKAETAVPQGAMSE
jgi:hypothetical protein